MKITVLNNQSLFDIAIQYFGSAESAMEVALLNDLSITDKLVVGQELELPKVSAYENKERVNYYATNNIYPATSESVERTEEIINVPDGIDYMIIGKTFIIR
jgi:LysM repeat protein